MTNHDDGDDDGDDDGNEDGNNDDNAASGLGSYGPIFNPITTTWSRLGLSDEDRETTTTTLQPWIPMYLRVVIYLPYKHPKIHSKFVP